MDPDFQPKMVEFRMEYCDGQLDSLLDSYYTSTNAPAASDAPAASLVDEALALDAPIAPSPDRMINQLLISARDKLAQGESEAARDQLVKGFEIDPDNAALRLMAGLAQCQARKFSDAIYLLSELADEQPSNAPVRVALAAAYFGSGDTEKAQAELETAIRLAPDLGDAHYNLAQILLAAPTPDLEAVNRHYRRALALGAPPDLRVEAVIKDPGRRDEDQ